MIGENGTMNKEDVLKKSREEKEDEGTVYAENKGRRYGAIAFCSFFIVILLFNLSTGQSIHMPMSMFWIYVSAEACGKYSASKSKALLTTTVAGAIAAIGFLVCYILEVLRVGV